MADSINYKIAAYYMANTEIFDRMISNERSKYDSTEAYLSKKWQQHLSVRFAMSLWNDLESINLNFRDIVKEIKSHRNSAEEWIAEFERMKLEAGSLDEFINSFVMVDESEVKTEGGEEDDEWRQNTSDEQCPAGSAD